jgi:hypothetical protein
MGSGILRSSELNDSRAATSWSDDSRKRRNEQTRRKRPESEADLGQRFCPALTERNVLSAPCPNLHFFCARKLRATLHCVIGLGQSPHAHEASGVAPVDRTRSRFIKPEKW